MYLAKGSRIPYIQDGSDSSKPKIWCMEVFQATTAGGSSSCQLNEAPDLNLANVVAADDVTTPAKKTPTSEMTGLTPSGFMTQLLENNFDS